MSESKTPRTDAFIKAKFSKSLDYTLFSAVREFGRQLETELAASKAREEALAQALDAISKWQLPKGFELDCGSNGSRDYFRNIAERRLEAWRAAK